MGLQTEFLPLSVDALPAFAADRKREGWRFVQLLAVRTDAGCDLVYSFMKDGLLENHVVEGVTKETPVPSITDQFLAAFVFENEAHDLFGIDIRDIAIDFGGKFYQLAQSEPMTIISPAQKAARDKAAKAAAAKAAKERSAQGEAAGAGGTAGGNTRSSVEAFRHGPREGRESARRHGGQGEEGGRGQAGGRGREGGGARSREGREGKGGACRQSRAREGQAGAGRGARGRRRGRGGRAACRCRWGRLAGAGRARGGGRGR